MKDIIVKITDTVTIVFPALIAVLGILGLTQVVPIAEGVEQVILICLGVASSVASIWFNRLVKSGQSAFYVCGGEKR
jgi:hypothetical protein